MKLLSRIPTIQDEEKFYGYIIGLGIEPDRNDDAPLDKMYASFEYNGEIQIWMVPDPDLFQILAEHLCSIDIVISISDSYVNQKLYIEKKNGKWIVDVP
jgi:hypothetical protein